MAGRESLLQDGDTEKRVVQLGGSILNRYWDDNPIPRQESFKEDLELAASYSGSANALFRNIRAAAETGWDFSSRWFRDASDLSSIRTSEIVPIDLNALMFKLEETLAKTYSLQGNRVLQVKYETLAKQRKDAIQTLFYDDQQKMFVDLDLLGGGASPVVSLAGVFPLYFGLALNEQAQNVAKELKENFLKPGGWVTTLKYTTHQWDAPNGWAPLQWMVYRGLKNYGFHGDAELGARRWIENNLLVYRQTGNLLEKYNVEALGTTAGGGEYEVQYGFGWTNAVLLKFMNALDWKG
jgi:alpha,alpha-trehalase